MLCWSAQLQRPALGIAAMRQENCTHFYCIMYRYPPTLFPAGDTANRSRITSSSLAMPLLSQFEEPLLPCGHGTSPKIRMFRNSTKHCSKHFCTTLPTHTTRLLMVAHLQVKILSPLDGKHLDVSAADLIMHVVVQNRIHA